MQSKGMEIGKKSCQSPLYTYVDLVSIFVNIQILARHSQEIDGSYIRNWDFSCNDFLLYVIFLPWNVLNFHFEQVTSKLVQDSQE